MTGERLNAKLQKVEASPIEHHHTKKEDASIIAPSYPINLHLQRLLVIQSILQYNDPFRLEWLHLFHLILMFSYDLHILQVVTFLFHFQVKHTRVILFMFSFLLCFYFSYVVHFSVVYLLLWYLMVSYFF